MDWLEIFRLTQQLVKIILFQIKVIIESIIFFVVNYFLNGGDGAQLKSHAGPKKI
jgi:hypothetical protein